MGTEIRSAFVVLFAFFVFQLGLVIPGHCQAWVAPKHTGSFSTSYLNELSDKTYFGNGETTRLNPATGVMENNSGELRTQGVYFDFTYSFTDKFAVSASIPYFAKRYNPPHGQDPFAPYSGRHLFPDGTVPLDDGHYHGSFQDVGLRLRYNLTARPFMITPYVEFNTPSNDYLFFSHAATGTHVRSLGLGVYLGGALDRIIPNAYIQGRYGYTFDQEILDISRHRNVLDVEFGYFITPSVRAFTIFAGEITKGGLNIPGDIGLPDAAKNPLYFHHGQITRSNYLNWGLGGQYSFNERVDFFGLISHMITARNLHNLAYGITFGFSWGFGGSPQRPCHC